MTLQTASPARSQLAQKVHCFAHLWKVERTDGLLTLRLTDHARVLTFFEASAFFNYTPIGGFGASAQQRLSGLDDQNLEAFGEVSIAAITDADLRGGRYREAKVTQSVVDWRFPWLGAIETQVFWFVDATFDQEKWKVQISGIPGWLRYPTGGVYGRDCDNDFLDADCLGGDAPLLQANDVSAFLCAVQPVGTLTRSVFSATGPFGGGVSVGIYNMPAGYWDLGKITWRTGLNAGIVSEIRVTLNNVPSVNYLQVTLNLPTPFDIVNGDQFDMVAGCDKLFATCKAKWPSDNHRNFAGYLTIPGTDKQIQNAGPG